MGRVATAARCILIVLAALALRLSADQRRPSETSKIAVLTVDTLAELVPDIDSVTEPDGNGLQQIRTQDGRLLEACQTSPDSDVVVGYRGSSNVLLILDENGVVTQAELLNSADTAEHVAAVRQDNGFLRQFHGWTQGDHTTFTQIDATTGATLTSLAIAEGITLRLSGHKPSLRFPEAFAEDDLALFTEIPDGAKLQILNDAEAKVLQPDGNQTIGRLYRTGPLADAVSGYQGPSEFLLFEDESGLITAIRLRRTFDNEPYDSYLNEDDYFWRVFLQKRFEDLKSLDPEAEQVEGVSGATMTSLAAADTIIAAAREYSIRKERDQTKRHQQEIRWSAKDRGTGVILVLGMLIGLTRLRGFRTIQLLWLLVLVVYFGLMTGNLISLAVIMGWAAEGAAWRLAPGLFAVIAISLILPPVTKRNLYCTHICPHGAAQQLLRRLKLKRWRPNAALLRRLRWLPGVVLVAAAGVTFWGVDAELSAWEPFNAWIWYIAGPASLTLAVISLLLSARIPMAWCRYGCATGRLLEYVRHSARASRITFADYLLSALTAAAWLWLYLR